jgi:hypothetical protein
MTRRKWWLAGSGLAAIAIAVAGASWITRPADPREVIQAFDAARNAGHIDDALGYLGESGQIFDTPIHLPGGRDRLRQLFEAQRAAGHVVDDRECTVAENGETVTCRYHQTDAILQRWGIAVEGEHRYRVRDGRLVYAFREHDRDSAATLYAATSAFHAWVADVHPALVDLIWVDPTSALYTTADGAEAVLTLLDEYEAARNSAS